ncbi:MAG: SH3 domain-containing protein [Clostridia bacterium]|nr:SH3 domain-containing protein [Clostridia bacterium]
MHKRWIAVVLAALMLMLAALSAAATDAYGVAFVYTSNGGNLNLRDGPGTDYQVITSIPYGEAVRVNSYIGNSWVEVTYGNHSGYVMGRYLTFVAPPDKPKPNPPPAPPTDSLTSLKEMFKGFSFINYTVQVRPSTPGGFVHMRWAPTKASDPIRDYHQHDVLMVIAQNNTWAQVVDPDTGVTGFMMRAFLTDFGVQ